MGDPNGKVSTNSALQCMSGTTHSHKIISVFLVIHVVNRLEKMIITKNGLSGRKIFGFYCAREGYGGISFTFT